MTTRDSTLNQLTRRSRFAIGSDTCSVSPNEYVEALAPFLAKTAQELVAMLQPDMDGVCSYPWPGETIRLKFDDTARIQPQPLAADATTAGLSLYGIANLYGSSVERAIRGYSNKAVKLFGVQVTMLGSRVEAVFDYWGQDPFADERETPLQILTIEERKSARAGEHADSQMIIDQTKEACAHQLIWDLFTEVVQWTLERWPVEPLPRGSSAGYRGNWLDAVTPVGDTVVYARLADFSTRRYVLERTGRFPAPERTQADSANTRGESTVAATGETPLSFLQFAKAGGMTPARLRIALRQEKLREQGTEIQDIVEGTSSTLDAYYSNRRDLKRARSVTRQHVPPVESE